MARAGRPTDLDEDIVQQAWEYVESFLPDSDTESPEGELIPTKEGLACYLKCSVASIYNWRNQKGDNGSQFLEAMDALDAMQANMLVNGGLSGNLNQTITKLILTKHGYSDKSQQEISGPEGGPVQTENKWIVQPVKTRG